MAAAAERLETVVGFPGQLPDEDPAETQEWLESLDGLVDHAGRTRAARRGRVEALVLSTDVPELRSGVDAGPADPLGIHSARKSNSSWWQQRP